MVEQVEHFSLHHQPFRYSIDHYDANSQTQPTGISAPCLNEPSKCRENRVALEVVLPPCYLL